MMGDDSMDESGARCNTYIGSIHLPARDVELYPVQELDGNGPSRGFRYAPRCVLQVMRGGPQHCGVDFQV